MNPITQIIEAVLVANSGKCLDNEEERQQVAEQCANKLLSASFAQLASVIGGTIECDQTGQVVIHTGHYDEDAHYDNLAATEKAWS